MAVKFARKRVNRTIKLESNPENEGRQRNPEKWQSEDSPLLQNTRRGRAHEQGDNNEVSDHGGGDFIAGSGSEGAHREGSESARREGHPSTPNFNHESASRLGSTHIAAPKPKQFQQAPQRVDPGLGTGDGAAADRGGARPNMLVSGGGGTDGGKVTLRPPSSQFGAVGGNESCPLVHF
jgi:hypothetical protein